MEEATNVVVEETTQKLEEQTSEPTVQELQEKLSKVEQANAQLYARLKKEKEAVEPTVSTDTNSTNAVDSSVVEELRLVAQGMSDEELATLKIVQKGLGEGVTLAQAMDNDVFKSYKEKKDDEKRREQAQLPSSHGFARKSDKPIKDMTRDEHKAFVDSLRRK